MKPDRFLTAACALAVAMVILCPAVQGWSNGGYSADPENPDYGTHDWIADRVLSLQTRDVSHFMTTYHDSYLIGTEAPDNPDYIGDSWNHHVYYYSDGSVQDNASAKRAGDMYGQALSKLVAGDFPAAAYYMGAMTHYIADMGVFGHTMGADTDWGAEVHHSDYESYFESILVQLTLPPGVTLGNASASDAAMGLARNVTFGSGAIQPNVWMDGNYDWSDTVFEASAMESLYRSVHAAAAAVNHLLEAAAPDDDLDPADPDQDEPTLSVPGPPASLEVHLHDGDVLLTWSPPLSDGGSPVIEYLVFRGVDQSDYESAGTVPSLSLTWEDGQAEDGATYVYIVHARNAVGLSAPSESVSITVPEADIIEPIILSTALGAAIAGAVSAILVLMRRRANTRPRK